MSLHIPVQQRVTKPTPNLGEPPVGDTRGVRNAVTSVSAAQLYCKYLQKLELEGTNWISPELTKIARENTYLN